MNRYWGWVIVGGVLEAVYPAVMGLSDGLSDLQMGILAFALSILATVVFNFGLKGDIPIGPAYAVWVGIGVAGIALIDIVFFGVVFSSLSYLFLFMVLVGAVGLNLISAGQDEAS